ncbi:MAG: SCO family protein [Chitinophagia bacterium]|nr:SCO family protein [Chitinophagia bacterium]
MNNKTTGIILVSFFIVLGVVFLSYYYKVSSEANKPLLPILGPNESHHVDTFSFIDQDGQVITNKDVAGKICVVSYFFATCRGICPKMNENMTQVYKAYRGNSRVVILSHTVDPVKDTVAALKAYSLRFDADGKQWKFLTGDKQKLYNMARYSYLLNAEDDTAGVAIEDDFIHDNHYSLVDGTGHIRGFYDGLKQDAIKKLITDIGVLLKEQDDAKK